MPVSALMYGPALTSLTQAKMNLALDSMKVMLTTSVYVPAQDTHQFKASVTGEVVGTGYTAGGVVLATVTTAYNATTNTLTFDAADSSWSNATITARYAVIYDDTPTTDATKPLLAYVDFGADVSSSAGAFTLAWDAAGIASFSVA